MISVIIPIASQNGWPKNHGPQSLVSVDNKKTLIEYQISKIRSVYPDSEIIVVVGYEADKVIKKIPKDIKIIENELHVETGTVRSISMALRVCFNNKVLIINGDILFEAADLKIPNQNKSFILVNKEAVKTEIGVNVVNGKTTSFAFGVYPNWSKILYLGPEEIDQFKNIVYDKSKRKWHTHEACNSLLDQGGVLYAITCNKTVRNFKHEHSF